MPLELLLSCLIPCLACPVEARGEELAPCPFAGHNCYSDLGVAVSTRRLARALNAGLRYIEVDVHHRCSPRGFVVTHKGKDPPSEPMLEDFLQPLWRRWTAEQGDHLLIIDFKAGRPDAVAKDLDRILQRHRDALARYAPDGKPIARGAIRVCLTGSGRLGQAYIDYARRRGELLALRDTGARGKGKEGVRRVLREPRPAGVGYLTLHFGSSVLRVSPEPEGYLPWLREIALGARRRGYHLRVYTLNVLGPERDGDVLKSGRWDRHWRACVQAGVEMIATDNYQLAAEWWEQIGRELAPPRPHASPSR